MTKKEIQILAKDSYTNNKLDEKKVMEFAGYMNRKDSKKYIHVLLAIEKQKNVIIATTDQKSYNGHKEMFEKIFADKVIITLEDPALLLGLRIIDNDMIYEKSLKQNFESMIMNIDKNYD